MLLADVTRLFAANEQSRAGAGGERVPGPCRCRTGDRQGLRATASDDRARCKLAHRIGTTRALDDVRYLAALLRARRARGASATSPMSRSPRSPPHGRDPPDGARTGEGLTLSLWTAR